MQRRALLFAFACDPTRGSEPGAGAAIVQCAANFVDELFVLTRKEPDYSPGELAERLGPNVSVECVGPGKRGERLPTYVRYLWWIFAASRRARELRREQGFAVLHHVTYASDWFVNPLLFITKRRGERWIWGPAGGASYAPHSVSRVVTQSRALPELVRKYSTASIRFLVHRALRGKVDVALALNEDSRQVYLRAGFDDVLISSNLVLDYDALPRQSQSTFAPTLVYASRGVAWKGLPLVLRSVELLSPRWRVIIAGPLTDTETLKGLVPEGEAHRVSFLGALSRDETFHLIASASALALPSLHDSAPWVAAEAAALGVPVVCLNLGGVSAMAGKMSIVVDALPSSTLPQRFVACVENSLEHPRTLERKHTVESLTKILRPAYGFEERTAVR